MALPLPTDGTLANLLCILGKVLVILLLGLAEVVATLFGIPIDSIQDAITAVNTADCA